ncbi:MAG: c-type cytochrome [Myxococcales bacterium]|nr:c-type cytochrome [Myxococcales bacterium]
MNARSIVLSLAFACTLVACKPSAPAAPLPAASRAQEMYSSRCVACHGPQGRGDGAAAAGLTPRPRDFADPSWHARATDEHLRRILVGGGSAVGLSGMMPPNPELATDTALRDALVAHVRTLMQRR